MLKACWDCLVGDGTRVEEPYESTQLNGNINRAPPWPQPQLKNEKMYLLPKILNSNDNILVQGKTFSQRSRLTIGLLTGYNSPDHTNVACQLEILFNEPSKIAIQIVENGYSEVINDENQANDYFPDESFEINFRVRSPEIIDVDVGNSYLATVPLKHDVNNIRYLTVHGDVDKVTRLDFSFG